MTPDRMNKMKEEMETSISKGPTMTHVSARDVLDLNQLVVYD